MNTIDKLHPDVVKATMHARIPGWAASWPADRNGINEDTLAAAVETWTTELNRVPTRERALSLVVQQLGAVAGLDPVGERLASVRTTLLARVNEIVSAVVLDGSRLPIK